MQSFILSESKDLQEKKESQIIHQETNLFPNHCNSSTKSDNFFSKNDIFNALPLQLVAQSILKQEY